MLRRGCEYYRSPVEALEVELVAWEATRAKEAEKAEGKREAAGMVVAAATLVGVSAEEETAAVARMAEAGEAEACPQVFLADSRVAEAGASKEAVVTLEERVEDGMVAC